MDNLEQMAGFFLWFNPVFSIVVTTIIVLYIGYKGLSLLGWVLGVMLLSWGWGLESITVWVVLSILATLAILNFLRVYLISYPILLMLRYLNVLPKISETEQIALNAGTVWIDGDLFSGKPNFKKLINEPYPTLSEKEQTFLDGPVETVCQMTNDWETHQKNELPKEVWDYLKKEKFFGMIIPESFGGLGFSAIGHSAVISKLASRCSALSITTMVPNSLGPAGLILHYGTDSQKKYYLPRLATGEEIPCFGLTEPGAGSDASSMQATGIIFKDSEGALKINLNWNKRWITLAAVSTVIGLAFKLKDPDHLISSKENLGITCALVPSNKPGITLDHRHDPLGIPFFNCPTQGKDVVINIDDIIGGKEGAGKGWLMLMESLAAGRGISLPSTCSGGAKLVTRATSAFCVVRQQFGLSIGKFEGIEEPLAQMGAGTYLLDAMRTFTCGGIDGGEKPSVISAIVKYHSTETLRKIVNMGMDIFGGAGITRGPKNLIASAYTGLPIGITVEGANILTRTLIIFGQGLIRCHPFLLKQVEAIENKNPKAFDAAFWGQIRFLIRNIIRWICLSVTRGYLTSASVSGPSAKYFKKLSWVSAQFAVMADLVLIIYGGNLKRKEKVSGRLADILSSLYCSMAVLRRFQAEGRKKEDFHYLEYNIQTLLYQAQEAFHGVFNNLGWWTKPLRLWLRLNPFVSLPSDKLTHKIANNLQFPGDARERLFKDMFLSKHQDDPLNQLEKAFEMKIESNPIVKKIKDAIHKKTVPKKPIRELINLSVDQNIITKTEKEILENTNKIQNEVIQVDSFKIDKIAPLTRT